MSIGDMEFQDISRSLDSGDFLHKDLRSKDTARTPLGRMIVEVRKKWGLGTDYNICVVAESIFHKAESSDFKSLNTDEKRALSYILSKLHSMLSLKGHTHTQARTLAERARMIESALLGHGFSS